MEHGAMLHIKSDMQGFILLDRITHADANSIAGMKTFNQAPVFMGIESLAQLGAYHVRFLSGFKKHAFLLAIRQFSINAAQPLSDLYQLEGKLLSRSAAAFSHSLKATQNGQTVLSGEFLFATVDYDDHFQQEILENHYRKAFSCLQSDLKTS